MPIKQKLEQLKQSLIKFKHQKYDLYNWEKTARPEQKIPKSHWNTWCIIAGRGFGKTRTGAEAVRTLVDKAEYRSIGLIGASINEIRNVMLDGCSGLLSIYPQHKKPKYYPSINLIKWNNGAKGYIISADNIESIRGYQFDLVWIDEFAKLQDPDKCWNQISMALRLGNHPKAIITTTPRSIQILKQLMKRHDTYYTSGSTHHNQHLSQNFLDKIKDTYHNTVFSRQEIYGEIIDLYTLWSPNTILYTDSPDSFDEIIISIDPAITCNNNSDETGIIVIGHLNRVYYILEDASIKSSNQVWISKTIDLYQRYRASKIVIEINQGGHIFKEIFNSAGIRNIVEMRARENKFTRAQQAFMLYEKKQVYHTRKFAELEEQMLDISQSKKHNKSPDRLDALTWGLIYFLKNTFSDIIDIW